MEQQLPTAVAAAPKAAAAEAAGPLNAAICASQNRQQLLRLAIQRQQQQEERQQQRPKQQQSQEARPHARHATLLKQQGQEQVGHRDEQWQYFEQQHQQQRQRLHEQQLLNCVHHRTKDTAMQNSSSVGLGSGSVSTANSGSESGSRSASDDDEERGSQRYELRRKAAGGVADKEYGRDEIQNMPVPQQHSQQILEVHKQQAHSGQQHPQQQLEEYLQQYQWRQQQQSERSLQHQIQQQLELQQCCLQDSRQPFQQHGVEEDPSQEQQQERDQEQEQQLGTYTEAVAVEKPLMPYTEEVDLGIDVKEAFLDELLPQTTTVHNSASPLFFLPFSLPADMASAAPGFYHVSCGHGHVGGPVRPARKKMTHSTPPPCPTVSTSYPSTATVKGGGHTGAGRMYRNSRITEVKSFPGTLEEYLVFRRQQAEREKAAAAARRGRCSRIATAAADHELPESKKAGTLDNGSRRAASMGQHFTENTAAKRSSRSSSRAISAGGRSGNAGEVSVKDLNAAKEKGGDVQSRWKEHLQQLFAWRRNVGAKEQTHRTTRQKLQLWRQASQESQHDGSRRSSATSSSFAAGAREALPALNRLNALKKDIPQFQVRMSGGDDSFPVFREEAKEEVADEDIAGRTMSNSPSRHRMKDISSSQAEQDKLEGHSGLRRWATPTCDSGESPDAQVQQANDNVSVVDNEETQGLGAMKEGTINTYKKDAEKEGANSKERKFIPLEMRNGEIVWPTDRPFIPLNAWIFQNFSANEPLDPQNWVHLPNVGPAVSPPAIPIPPAQQQSRCPPPRPPISCSTAPPIHPPFFSEVPQTGPVKLPPVKLPVGYEVDPFIVYTEARPDVSTPTNMPPETSAPKVAGEARRSRSLNGRLGGTPPAKPKSVYTQFVKQSYVRHRLTSFEGLVVRTEEAGRVLLVRSKEGQLRKLRRDECESTGFVCASTHPSERVLTDAAHLHATRLLSATVGSAPWLGRSISSAFGSGGTTPATLGPVPRGNAFSASAASSANKLPFQPRADLRRQRPEREVHTQRHSSTQHALLGAAAPRSASVPRHYHCQAARALLDFFGLSRKFAASSSLPTHSEEVYNDADKQHREQVPLEQVPDLQEVLMLDQLHANPTMHNTVALKNMATVPSIRAVDSQVTVEAIRIKKYTLEGKDEENLIPVFSGGASEEKSKAASAAAAAIPAAALHERSEIPRDATRLLLQKHEALEDLKKREKELMADEIIYAQDAPEATRASGIAPPTIVKETLVIPPKEDELFQYIWQAPGIVPPLSLCLNAVEKPRKTGATKMAQPGGSDVSSVSTQSPNVQHVYDEGSRGVGEETDRTVVGTALPLHTEAPAWFSDLKAQFRSQLLQQYQQTGSMEAATLAISSGGYTPLLFTAAPSPAIQRKQAKVLRDELRQMDFAPVEPNSPLQAL